MISSAKQLEALQGIIRAVTNAADEHNVPVEHHNVVPHGGLIGQAIPMPDTQAVPEELVPVQPAPCWQPKNTLVRAVFKEIVHGNTNNYGITGTAASGKDAITGSVADGGLKSARGRWGGQLPAAPSASPTPRGALTSRDSKYRPTGP